MGTQLAFPFENSRRFHAYRILEYALMQGKRVSLYVRHLVLVPISWTDISTKEASAKTPQLGVKTPRDVHTTGIRLPLFPRKGSLGSCAKKLADALR